MAGSELCRSTVGEREMTCRTCKWLEVEYDHDTGKISYGITSKFVCGAPTPLLPALPDSITNSVEWYWPVFRKWMDMSDGKNCPTFKRKARKG